MTKKIIILLCLFAFKSYALDEFLPKGNELNKLIELYGLEVDSLETKEYPVILGNVNQNNVPKGHQINDESDVVGDMVKTIQAAGVEADELIFYDYKDEKKKDPKRDLTQLIDKKKISKNVNQAIKREQKVKSPPIVAPEQMMDYLKALKTLGKGPEKLKANSKKRIYVYEGKMDSSLKEVIYNFEFLPTFDERDSILEIGDGFIEIEKHLNSSQGILRGGIIKRDYVRTKIEIPLKQGKSTLKVPLLEVEALEKFLEKENLKGLGGFILLDLENSVMSVDIDATYEAKIYLDEHLKVVEEGEEQFVFYVGVPMGNTLLKVLDKKKEIGQKIIHVTENELFFDKIKLSPGRVEIVELFEKNLLGKIETELNINGRNLNIFNTRFSAKNLGINTYEYYHPTLIQGSRKYFTLKSGEDEIFLGNNDKEKIEVPSDQFIGSVMKFLEMDSLYKQCIVQFNLTLNIHDFKAMGESEYDTLNIETYYLGTDGKFSDEINDLTEKVFIYGNFQGIVDGEITYEDGSKDYFQSYCSDSTYLVEQY